MANPNLHKDEMDRVYKVEGGGGGGIRIYNMEPLLDSVGAFIIHGANVNDLKTIFYISGSEFDTNFIVPMCYEERDGDYMIKTFDPDGPVDLSFNTMEPYLDGVKVSNEITPT